MSLPRPDDRRQTDVCGRAVEGLARRRVELGTLEDLPKEPTRRLEAVPTGMNRPGQADRDSADRSPHQFHPKTARTTKMIAVPEKNPDPMPMPM